jgi:hypothetical protein
VATPLLVCFAPSVQRLVVSRVRDAITARALPLDIVWVERAEEATAEDLLGGRYDVAVGRYPPVAAGLESETVLREQPALYLGRDDPLARQREVSLAALRGRRIRMFRRELTPRLYDAVLDDVRAAGVDVEIDTAASYLDWATDAMRSDIGSGKYVAIGFASASAVLHDVAVVPLRDATPVPVTVTRRSVDGRPETELFRELVQEVGRDAAAAVADQMADC